MAVIMPIHYARWRGLWSRSALSVDNLRRVRTQAENDVRTMKRVQVNDPVAIRETGLRHHCDGNYTSALPYLTKAAGLGDEVAHFNLSVMYEYGQGVEKDKKKQIHHLEEAAIGGYFKARHSLGNEEFKDGRIERAVKHWIIAASSGDDYAIETISRGHAAGFVSREDCAAALLAPGCC